MVDDGPRRRATINDVAEKAGVAIGTVSRYLNGMDLRKSNRREIELAIEALGFQRNPAAVAMKTDRTGMVGFLVSRFDEFHTPLLNHLSRGFRQNGRTMLAYVHDGDEMLLRNAMEFFSSQRVDAVVMAGSPNAPESVAALTNRGVPVVIFNNDMSGPKVDRVFVDNLNASCRAVEHLLGMGHRKIATCYGRLADSSGRQRREGYERALLACGIPLVEDFYHPGDWSTQGGYDAIQKFMSLPEPPTAVFSANYRMTFGMLQWLRENGRESPGDIAIVSFDDVELFRLYNKGITAIAQPISEIADAIRSYVTTRLTTPDIPDIRSRTLDCRIILRGSSSEPSRR
jgi:LacI family transcriptional regulator